MKYHNVREIAIKANIDEVNDLLKKGWEIIEIFKPSENKLLFVLGFRM